MSQKLCKDMTFEELTDWAAAYLLKELLAGSFRSGVHLVLSQAVQWKNPK